MSLNPANSITSVCFHKSYQAANENMPTQGPKHGVKTDFKVSPESMYSFCPSGTQTAPPSLDPHDLCLRVWSLTECV